MRRVLLAFSKDRLCGAIRKGAQAIVKAQVIARIVKLTNGHEVDTRSGSKEDIVKSKH